MKLPEEKMKEAFASLSEVLRVPRDGKVTKRATFDRAQLE